MEEERDIKGFDIGIMKRLSRYLKPYRSHTAAAFAALAVSIAAELAVPVLVQYSIDNHVLADIPDPAGLLYDALLLGALLLAGFAAAFLQVYLMSFAGQGVMKALRTDLMRHILEQSLSFHGTNPVGRLVTRVTNDVETISEFFSSVVMTLLKNLVLMFGVVLVLFRLDARLAAATVASLPPVLLITIVFRVKARDAYRLVRRRVSGLNTFLSERFSGIKVVQALAREARTVETFDGFNTSLLTANLGEIRVFAVFRPLITMLGSFSLAVVIYAGAGLSASGTLTLGVLIAFLDLVEKFYRPLLQLSEQFSVMQSAMAGGERVFELLDSEDRIPDCSTDDGGGCLGLEDAGLSVEFRNVHFSYRNNEPVLKGIDFLVKPGETLAVAGYTGSGKTTIANLAARFWDADSGQILIAGQDIRRIPPMLLHRRIQTIQQDVFLFAGTVKENICLGMDFSNEQIAEAAEISMLAPVLQRLPGGLDYVLTEGGSNLSAGQRQLVAFTRVIVRNPPVIIMDEATASIDTETEYLIRNGLANILKNRTSIVIAHRLSTISDADRILVLAGGRIAESGTHEELLRKNGLYGSLYSLQFGKNV